MKVNTKIAIANGFSIAAVVGTVVTGVLTARAAVKCRDAYNEAREERGGRLTLKETVQVCAKDAAPALISEVLTVGCIFGTSALSKNANAALMASNAVLSGSILQNRESAKKSYVRHQDNFFPSELDGDEITVVDEMCGDTFVLSRAELLSAMYQLNRKFQFAQCVSVADWKELTGRKPTAEDRRHGWVVDDSMLNFFGAAWIDFFPDWVSTVNGDVCHIYCEYGPHDYGVDINNNQSFWDQFHC